MTAVTNMVIRFKAINWEDIIHAARFDGSPESVAAIREVARKCDSGASVAVVPELDVVVVPWEPIDAGTDYVLVKRGEWLSFSEQFFKVYVTDDEDLEYWYERA